MFAVFKEVCIGVYFTTRFNMWRVECGMSVQTQRAGIVQLLGVLFCHLMSVDPLHKLMTTQQYGETSPLITPFSVRLSLTLIGFSFPFFG